MLPTVDTDSSPLKQDALARRRRALERADRSRQSATPDCAPTCADAFLHCIDRGTDAGADNDQSYNVSFDLSFARSLEHLPQSNMTD